MALALNPIGSLATPEVIGAAVASTAEDRAAAELARDQVLAVPTTTDGIVSGLFADPDSDTATALTGQIEAVAGRSTINRGVVQMGQSNAVGYGEGGNAVLDTSHPDVYQFSDVAGDYYRQTFLATEPLQHLVPAVTLAAGVGHGMTFAKEYVRSLRTGEQVVMIPTGEGSTGFSGTSKTWMPGKVATNYNLFDLAMAQIRAWIAQDPEHNVLDGLIWHQGEGDTPLMTQAEYTAALVAVIDGVRAEFGEQVWVLIGGMVPDRIAKQGGGYITVDAAHRNVAAVRERVAFVEGPQGLFNVNEFDTDGTVSKIHYNAAGQRALGRSMARAVPRAQANLIGSEPVTPGAISFAQTGSSVRATWGLPLGRATNFLIQQRINGGAWTTVNRPASIDNHHTFNGLTLGSTFALRVATVNEEGTSEYSTSEAFTLVNVPGQVTGLTAADPGANRQPLTWTPTTSASSYLVEYKRTADTAWKTFATVTAAACIVNGLLTSTGYDYRVTALNAAGSGAVSAVVSATTSTLPALVTDVGVAAASGWSAARKIRSDYAGAALRVRNGSGTLVDIGFDATGALDEAALLAHVGAGDGFVHTYYDQIATRNWVQTTTALQPRIAAAGVVSKVNGVPAIEFLGAQYMVHTSAFQAAAGRSSTLSVHRSPAASATQVLYAEDNAGVSGTRYSPIYYASSGQPTFFYVAASVGSGVPVDGALRQQTSIDTGTTKAIRVDGVQRLAPAAYTTPTLTLAGGTLGCLRGGAASLFYIGQSAELVVWTADLTDAQRSLGEANQRTYFGTA